MILLVSSAFWSLLAVPGLEMYYSILMATFPLRVFTSSSLCVRMWPSVQTGSLSAMRVDWIQKSHTQSLLHTTVQPYPWCSLPSTRSHCLRVARPRIIQILCLLFALQFLLQCIPFLWHFTVSSKEIPGCTFHAFLRNPSL